MSAASLQSPDATLPDDRAAALAGVTIRQLRYWEETLLLRPSTVKKLSQRNTVRLYDTRGLLELLVVAALRKQHKWSLQHIRVIVRHLRDRGYELSQIVFAVDRATDRIYFQTPDGTWEDDRLGRQTVLSETIHLEPLRERIREAFTRDAGKVGQIERKRGRLGSKPVIAGTRVPVATVRSRLAHGSSTEEILKAYPVLTAADVETVRRSHAG